MMAWGISALGTLRRGFWTYWLAAQDERTPLIPKLVILAAIGYYLQPFDLIPDNNVFGYADEILMLPLALFAAPFLVPRQLVSEFAVLAQRIEPAVESRLFGLIGALAASWVIVPATLHLALPLDVVESGMWGREWLIGSYKHPAMPSWFLEVARLFTGGKLGWSAYLTSQLFNASSLALTFLLVRDLIGERAAVAHVLSLFGIEHFSWRSMEFNHDIAQIPFWLLSMLFAWRAVERQTLAWWAALGVFGALGLYAKLSHSVILLVIFGWMLWDTQARKCFASPGPWLAFGLFCFTATPLASWLIGSGFAPLHFATERGGPVSAASYLVVGATVALVVLPAFASLTFAGLFSKANGEIRKPLASAPRPMRRPEAFLIVMAVAPIGLTIALALLAGSGLRQDWLAPMLCLLPALVVYYWREALSDDVVDRLWSIAAAMVILVPLCYAAVVSINRVSPNRKLMRANWPQAAIARQLHAAWTQATGKPLKIVAGHNWVAGLVGINDPDTPSILFEGDLARSPWITPARMKREGLLAVWTDGMPLPQEMQELVGDKPTHQLVFDVPSLWRGTTSNRKAAIKISYAVVPPRPGS